MLELGGDVLNPNAEAVVRRYEFYEYLGVYKQSDHEAQPLLGDSHADPSEIGAFLGAQNAQAMLAAVPEPSTLATNARRTRSDRLPIASAVRGPGRKPRRRHPGRHERRSGITVPEGPGHAEAVRRTDGGIASGAVGAAGGYPTPRSRRRVPAQT
jgi:hypothetical protein